MLTFVLIACAAGCARKAPRRPINVIVILVDTLRADHLSGYGYHRNTSPMIDRFARTGVLFERNWSQAPCTYPSVNSLLTSRYPVHLLEGQEQQNLGITEGIPTLAEMLEARGYDTYAISASPIVRVTPSRFNKAGGFGRGFDQFDEDCLWKDASCINRKAEGIVRTHASNPESRPFFLYLHYMDPHGPYQPPERFSSRFAGSYTGEKEWH
jgi:arylsulfatase